MARFRLVIIIIALLVVIAATVFWFQRNKPILVKITEVSTGEVQRTVTNTRAGNPECLPPRTLVSLAGWANSQPAGHRG